MTKAKTNTDTKAGARMIAARDFKDAGTERSFTQGEPVENIEPGAIENYRAAGLLVAEDANDAQQAAADGSVTA